MSEQNIPRRKVDIEIRVGGDEWKDALELLEEFVERIKADRAGHTLLGGVTSGGWYKITEDPEMTHERYFAAIEARKEEA